MIADQILKTTQSLHDRGLPDDSFFEVTFADGSVITEKETNWSFMSYHETVDYLGRRQMCFVSNFDISKIRITLNGLEAIIDNIPKEARVYQYVHSQRLLANSIDSHTLVGRGIGIICDGKVVEEKFINALENSVMGVRL